MCFHTPLIQVKLRNKEFKHLIIKNESLRRSSMFYFPPSPATKKQVTFLKIPQTVRAQKIKRFIIWQTIYGQNDFRTQKKKKNHQEKQK